MNIVILISGSGSNLRAIIEYINHKQLPINISAVISNNADAYGLTVAKNHHIKTYIIPDKKQDNQKHKTDIKTYSKSLLEVITPLKPDWIILAGFMRILSEEFIENFTDRILNIHPSLLPKYPGLNTHKKALVNKDAQHGCTVHVVTKELDAGPILAQQSCSIHPDDTEETLKNKVHQLEHQVYPKVIESLLTKK